MMKRRHAVAAVGMALAATVALPANAQGGKPLRIVTSFSPGGPVDFVARTLADTLGRQLGRPVIVDNKPGANGALGAMDVLRAEPDGNTLWITSVGAAAINPVLQERIAYNTARDFVPVSLVANNVEVFVVDRTLPVDDAVAFVQRARAQKQPPAIASSGQGSIPHLALVQLEEATGVKFLHVPYKGMSLALTDLVGGQVQGVFADVPAVMSQIEGGRLKALGIAAARRHPSLPQVKTFEEQGIKAVDTNNWYALFASAKTPPAVVAELNAAVRKTLADPGVSARLLKSGAEPRSSSPEELAALLKADTAKWSALIKSRNIRLDQ